MNEADDGKNDDVLRPWEQPGQERRDCLPHRGDQLLFWAKVGLVCNFVSWFFFPATLIGVPLCLFIVMRSLFDLREIAARTRERAGQQSTSAARRIAIGGLIAALELWGPVGTVFAVLIWKTIYP